MTPRRLRQPCFRLCYTSARRDGASLYRYQRGSETRWVSPENPTGAKCAGAREDRSAKGHAFETIPVGRAHTLAGIQGAGTIDRMWITLEDRSPDALRGLQFEIYWDGAATPAVSVPLGDFFLHAWRTSLGAAGPSTGSTSRTRSSSFYRSDDVAAVAYFYLDRPEGALPASAPAAERTADLRLPAEKK